MFGRVLIALLACALLAGCSGSDGAEGPTATIEATEPVATSSTTEAPPPEEEVEQAYLKSWEIYAEAMRELNPSLLEQAYVGGQLERTAAEVERFKKAGTPVRVQVDHDYTIELTAPDVAVIRDRFVNRSVLFDPETGEPTESEPNDVNDVTSTLKELSGRWYVIDIVRAF